MVNIIRPESNETQWAIFTQADELGTRNKGERKLRADLTMLYGTQLGKEAVKQMDRVHHLAVTLEDNKIREHRSNKPLEAGFRKVAVKIASKGEGEEAVDQYIILNINSLAKRLGVSKDTIKEHEKKGKVDDFIRDKLKVMYNEQEDVSNIVRGMRVALNTGQPFHFGAQEKKDFIRFIKAHFNDKNITDHIEEICETSETWSKPITAESRTKANQFIDDLSSQIWWDSADNLKTPQKVALTPESAEFGGEIPECWIFWGKPFERAGHPAEETRLINFLLWDTENAYAIRVGDFLYTSPPTTYSKDEVPLRLTAPSSRPEKWILVNVSDLEKKFGLTKKEIREAHQKTTIEIMPRLKVTITTNTLLGLLQSKLDIINAFDFPEASIHEGFYHPHGGYRWIEEAFSDQLQRVIENHPNKEVKAVAQSIRNDFVAFLDTLPHQVEPRTLEQEDERNSLIDDRLVTDSRRLQHKLAALGALRGKGHVEQTYRGEALARQKMSGKSANRMKMLPWDTRGRYAPQVREEVYYTKPEVASNEVALKITREFEGIKGKSFDEWLVFNKNSLKGRLGLSEAEIQSDGSSTLGEKLAAIDHFNMTFERDTLRWTNASDYRDWLEGARMQHPDSEVRALLQEAERELSEFEKEMKWATENPVLETNRHIPFLAKQLKKKLIAIGALSEERPREHETLVHPFFKPLDIAKIDEEAFNGVLNELNVNAGVYVGKASEIPGSFGHTGHAGKDMPRLSLVEGDDAHRYAIAFDGKLYANKPIPRSNKEVALALNDKNGVRVRWVLINVHSLGRLGLSSKEIREAVRQDRLDEVVLARVDKLSPGSHKADQLQVASIFYGKALPVKGHKGSEMPRMNLVEWDMPKNRGVNRYALAFDGEVYSSKPTPRSDKEVPCLMSKERGGYENWVLLNVHSLGRLGLSPQEVKKAAKKERLLEEIQNKIETINHFNSRFKEDLAPEGLIINSDHYREWMKAAITQHPDQEVRAILEKESKRTDLGGTVSREQVEELSAKLKEIGALPQSQQKEARGRAANFDGMALAGRQVEFNEMLDNLGVNIHANVEGAEAISGHKGLSMPRLKFTPGEFAERYAPIAFDGNFYPNKPTPRSSKEVPMDLRDQDGVRKGWVLINVHSLGRLGLSPKEVRKAAKNGKLLELVERKVGIINQLGKDMETPGTISNFILMCHNYTDPNATMYHPDSKVRKLLLNAAKQASGMEGNLPKFGNLVQQLQQDLQDIGAMVRTGGEAPPP